MGFKEEEIREFTPETSREYINKAVLASMYLMMCLK
jgi:hypothetical protein